LVAGLGIMEVCSSNEMGAPNASHLEQETTQPNRPKQTKISPGKRTYIHEWSNFRLVGNPDIDCSIRWNHPAVEVNGRYIRLRRTLCFDNRRRSHPVA
jgi:hypothetical protein